MIDIEPILSGNRLALSQVLTQIENDLPAGREALNQLFPYTGQAHLIGVTGAPGTGKSSLVNRLAHFYRQPQENQNPKSVAIVAVDPSSPFSGGAVLGDRVRMRDLAGDPGVFIRSMASRGSLGGLAHTTAGVVQAFDAAGYELIIIETVGAGQAEVDIARLAHTTLVIEAPGLGDDIQAIKAGILEIADILVINKADRPGVELTERALRGMLSLAHPIPRVFNHHGRLETTQPALGADNDSLWIPPIQRTVATEGEGISALADYVNQHYQTIQGSGELQRRDLSRLQAELTQMLQSTLMNNWRAAVDELIFQQVLEKLTTRSLAPWQAVEMLIGGDK
jgi:LAO/AO transport system kinase